MESLTKLKEWSSSRRGEHRMYSNICRIHYGFNILRIQIPTWILCLCLLWQIISTSLSGGCHSSCRSSISLYCCNTSRFLTKVPSFFAYAEDVNLIYVNETNNNELSSTHSVKSASVRSLQQIKKKSDKKLTINQILYKAGKRGLGGGIPGAIAGAVQVASLMWIRTIVNYQCRYGMSFKQALTILLKDGGIPRLYRGMTFALIQAPMARFVSTAANDGVQSLLSNLSLTKDWGPGRTTIVASIVVGLGRIVLMRK